MAPSRTKTGRDSSLPPPPPSRAYTAMLSNKMAGGIAGMMAKTFTAPLERIQILNQTGAATDTMYGTFRRILSDGGLRGLWRGNLVNCCRVFPHKAILFSANDYLQRKAPIKSTFLTGFVSVHRITF